jgi:hypothetical protein
VPQTDEPKPDEPQGAKRADAELASAYERIKTAQEQLAQLDRQVSGMERGGDGRPIRPRETGAEPRGAAVSEAAPSQKTSENKAAHPGAGRGRPVLLALAGFLLAVCIFGAAFASRYGNEAKAIMVRWAQPVSMAHKEASGPRGPATSLIAQAADAAEQPSPPAVPSPKETKDVPSTGPTTPADHTSADLAQSLQTITHDLAGINEKLDQLKNSYDQKLREQADAIQQLKTAQEQDARDNARIAAQIQAMQAQLTASPAKSATPGPALSSAPSSTPSPPKQENDVTVRQRQSTATPPRPKRPPAPWRQRPYMDEYWEDSYW